METKTYEVGDQSRFNEVCFLRVRNYRVPIQDVTDAHNVSGYETGGASTKRNSNIDLKTTEKKSEKKSDQHDSTQEDAFDASFNPDLIPTKIILLNPVN